MKVVFAGPSLHGLDVEFGDVELRRPAQQGDIERAVDEGASVIGLIDGHYQQVAAVWHKEILYALSKGVVMLGGASMGALRAAECHAFGMIPVGEIAWRYCRGELFDDADVALINGPAEMGFAPFTEALVDAEATILRLQDLGIATSGETQALLNSARRLFFMDRTADAIVERAELSNRDIDLRDQYERHRVRMKGHDALELIDMVRRLPETRAVKPDWELANSPFWRDRDGTRKLVTPV